MQVFSLHPIDTDVLDHFVQAVGGSAQPDATWLAWWRDDYARLLDRAAHGDERASAHLTAGLATALGHANPSIASLTFSLTMWEARIDRGMGMMLRPPARLFQDHGLHPAVARTMPIRLDAQLGAMGGSWIPDRLIDQAARYLDERLERTVARLVEAELPAIDVFAAAYLAVETARAARLGLYEAVDVIGPGGEAWPGMEITIPTADLLDPQVRRRVEEATHRPKKPGPLSRLFQRR